MPVICLFADDHETAEMLISQVVNDDRNINYFGVGLFPEATAIFEKYGMKSFHLDSYINSSEHKQNGIEASNLIFQLNQRLELDPGNGYSFNFDNLDLLYSCHFLNYLYFGYIFYYLITISNIIKKINPQKIYAFDLRKSQKFSRRPRSLFAEALINVCENKKISFELIKTDDVGSGDSLYGLNPSHYKYKNSVFPIIISSIFKNQEAVTIRLTNLFAGYFSPIQSILARSEKYFLKREKNNYIINKSDRTILYIGPESYYSKIMQKLSSSSITNVCLNSTYSEKSSFLKKGNVILINLRFLLDNFFDEEGKLTVAECSQNFKKMSDHIKKNKNVKKNFYYKGISFYNIFSEYLKFYVDKVFIENLKIYLAMKNFSKKFNVEFAFECGGWVQPETYSIHQALKSNNIKTAFLSHGLNVPDIKISPLIKGDGTLMPCDVLFAPGSEFLKGHVVNGLKDNKENYVTGHPFYNKGKKVRNPFRKYLVKKLLGLDAKKKIVLYPSLYGFPHLHRPNGVTFTEEFNFVKNIIMVLKKHKEFQFVVKSKHYTIPDNNYLELFNDNFPHALLRYGDLERYLSVTDVVINFNSSSGFDALLTGVPVIYKSPNGRGDWFEPYASKHNKPNYFLHAETYEDIPKICNNIMKGKFPEWYKDKMTEVPEKFLSYTGNESAKRIANIIKNKYLGQCL